MLDDNNSHSIRVEPGTGTGAVKIEFIIERSKYTNVMFVITYMITVSISTFLFP